MDRDILIESGIFDEEYYLTEYQDIKDLEVDPIEHYVKSGYKENRKPNADFDPLWYKGAYRDVESSGINAVIHYICHGKKEERFASENAFLTHLVKELKFFDRRYYLSEYPDVRESPIDAVTHYTLYGYKDKRKPNAEFDPIWYEKYYKDVNINPVLHYILYGKK